MPLPPVGVLPVIIVASPVAQKLVTAGAVTVLFAMAGIIAILTTLLIKGMVHAPEVTVRRYHVSTFTAGGTKSSDAAPVMSVKVILSV